MRVRSHLSLLLLLAGCVPELPQRERRQAAVAARGDALLREAMLARHAQARAAVGVAPLRWSRGLAAQALEYARAMAVTGRFQHSEQPEFRARQGENLWSGERGAVAYEEMFDVWAAERRQFVNAPAPGYSRTGRWQDAAHYMQIVWRRTTRVGCAVASNRDRDFLVCRYLPPGNVIGERAY